MARATVTSICRFCHANCGILVELEDGRPVRVTGDRANPAYHGFTCAKGRQLPALHAHPDRLLHSQKRTELHGIVYEGYQPCVRVLKSAEEKGLRRIG